MRMNICDPCYHYDKKLTAAAFSASYGTRVEKVKTDVCHDHKHPFKDCKSMEEAREIALCLKLKPVGTAVPK